MRNRNRKTYIQHFYNLKNVEFKQYHFRNTEIMNKNNFMAIASLS